MPSGYYKDTGLPYKPPSQKGKKASLETRVKLSSAFRGRKMSKAWRLKISKALVGERNPSWIGGKITKNGYPRIRLNNRYQREHRLVAQKFIGREL